jgi:MFS family permease
LAQTFRIPGVRSTALALATAQGLMVTLMSLTPLRAHHMGMDHAGIAALISGHVLGMFGFGWLTGPLIDRLGVRVGYVGGAALLAAAALSAPLPGPAALGISMFLLGLGWNLAFVSGSKALTRFPAAQGVTDGLGYVAAGVGTLAGGFVIARAGFPLLAHVCAAVALLPLLSAWRAGRPAGAP